MYQKKCVLYTKSRVILHAPIIPAQARIQRLVAFLGFSLSRGWQMGTENIAVEQRSFRKYWQLQSRGPLYRGFFELVVFEWLSGFIPQSQRR